MVMSERQLRFAIEAVIQRCWNTPRIANTADEMPECTPDEQMLLDALEEIATLVSTGEWLKEQTEAEYDEAVSHK